MRSKKKLWNLILEEIETQSEISIHKAMRKLSFSEEEGDLIFKECLDEELENKDALQFVNERIRFHNNPIKDKVCENCNFWFGREEKFKEMGDCLKISSNDLPANIGCIGKVEDEELGTIIIDGGIITGKKFGCVHFENRM